MAVKPHPEPLPLDAAPEPAQLLGLEPPQGGHVADARPGESGGVSPGDARNIGELQGEQIVRVKGRETVGLVHLGGDLRQEIPWAWIAIHSLAE
jgi:hypothetical protein